MIFNRWICYIKERLLCSSFFNSRKEWVVFREDVFDDYQRIERGNIGFKLGVDSFLYRIRLLDKDVSVMPGTFVSLNGFEPIQPLIKSAEEYIKSKNESHRGYHLEKCISRLKNAEKKLGVQCPAAEVEIKKALDVFEYYKSHMSWKDYDKGEKHFVCKIGNAILKILRR